MRNRDMQWSFDSRDLMRSKCSHCTELSVARELKVPGLQDLLEKFYQKPDSLAIRFGMKFETALEQELISNLGQDVQAPETRDLESTIDLMSKGVPVIYQGTLKGGSASMAFSGRPDFLLRGDYRFEFGEKGLTAVQAEGDPERYSAWDAKLSATPKPEYQNQVALYVDVLRELGFEAVAEHGLILGSRTIASFNADTLISQMIPVRDDYLNQSETLISNPPKLLGGLGQLICTASRYCDLCEYPLLCQDTRVNTNSLQLVAGITSANIESLATVGVETVRELAGFAGSTEKLSEEQTQKLSRQARLQQHTYDTGEHVFEILDKSQLILLPEPSPGDLFFDLEGFTFFDEPGGLEYLWGWSDAQGHFDYVWADNRTDEAKAFEVFMQDALDRQVKFPGAKIYHYANYEQTALKKLAERTGLFREEVATLLDTGVLVDLYKTVKSSLVLSQESYSIKKLENYYSFARSSSVKEAMGSMEYYDQYLLALEQDPSQAEMLKRQVIAYNQDDCASTLALYKWLVTLS